MNDPNFVSKKKSVICPKCKTLLQYQPQDVNLTFLIIEIVTIIIFFISMLALIAAGNITYSIIMFLLICVLGVSAYILTLHSQVKCANCGNIFYAKKNYPAKIQFGIEPEKYSGPKSSGAENLQNHCGKDVTTAITISFEEAVKGCNKKVIVDIPDKSGITVSKEFYVTIPAGVDNNQSIRIKGYGAPGKNGGSNGNILIELNVTPDARFKREGTELYTDVTITESQAESGCEIPVETLYGKILLKIEPGISNGQKIRIAGKGVPQLKDPNNIGNLYITVNIN